MEKIGKQYIIYTLLVLLLIFVIENNDIDKGIFLSWSIYNMIVLISRNNTFMWK